jgi:hypothetical protein
VINCFVMSEAKSNAFLVCSSIIQQNGQMPGQRNCFTR